MNREIKFRAWDNRDKKFVATGFGVIGEVTMFGVIDEYCFETKSKDQTTLDRIGDIEIEQFTGLHDKNGVEIYEGDIVSFEDDPNGLVKWNDKYSCWTYYEDDHISDCGDLFDWSQLRSDHYKFYIIRGNIHQNPELL